jgi:hypothetical protein
MVKPKTLQKRVNRCFSRTLAAFIAQGRTPAITMDTLHLRILNNLCFKPLEEKTLMQNNVEAKAKKIYERALQKP